MVQRASNAYALFKIGFIDSLGKAKVTTEIIPHYTIRLTHSFGGKAHVNSFQTRVQRCCAVLITCCCFYGQRCT
jgi:hypothetical protein